jgi:carboxymethylenebutenolidase
MLRRLILPTLVLAACSIHRSAPPGPQPDDHMAHMSAADRVTPSGAGAFQDRPGLPASNNGAPARLSASPRHGEWVRFAVEPGSTDSVEAWVVYPKTSGKVGVVVVVQEIFGLSSWIRGVADQVAAEGFIAIAPDFFSRPRGGPSTTELAGDSARKLSGLVPPAERNKIIVAAANWAMMQPSALQKYAVIGYCWGGATTFFHAIHGGVMGFSGGVAFYGLPYTTGGAAATATTPAVPATIAADSVAKIKVPMLLFNGSKDARIALAMPALDSIMKAMGKSYTGTNYEGAAHGFLRIQDDPKTPPDEAENKANVVATLDAWPKTIAFLKKQLKP